MVKNDDQQTWEKNGWNQNFNKENIKMKQSELENIVTELKNTVEGINSRLQDVEEWIRSLEDRVVEVIQTEQQKEKIILKN